MSGNDLDRFMLACSDLNQPARSRLFQGRLGLKDIKVQPRANAPAPAFQTSQKARDWSQLDLGDAFSQPAPPMLPQAPLVPQQDLLQDDAAGGSDWDEFADFQSCPPPPQQQQFGAPAPQQQPFGVPPQQPLGVPPFAAGLGAAPSLQATMLPTPPGPQHGMQPDLFASQPTPYDMQPGLSGPPPVSQHGLHQSLSASQLYQQPAPSGMSSGLFAPPAHGADRSVLEGGLLGGAAPVASVPASSYATPVSATPAASFSQVSGTPASSYTPTSATPASNYTPASANHEANYTPVSAAPAASYTPVLAVQPASKPTRFRQGLVPMTAHHPARGEPMMGSEPPSAPNGRRLQDTQETGLLPGLMDATPSPSNSLDKLSAPPPPQQRVPWTADGMGNYTPVVPNYSPAALAGTGTGTLDLLSLNAPAPSSMPPPLSQCPAPVAAQAPAMDAFSSPMDLGMNGFSTPLAPVPLDNFSAPLAPVPLDSCPLPASSAVPSVVETVESADASESPDEDFGEFVSVERPAVSGASRSGSLPSLDLQVAPSNEAGEVSPLEPERREGDADQPTAKPDRYDSFRQEMMPSSSTESVLVAEWRRCLQACYELIQEGVALFGSVSDLRTCSEVAGSRQGAHYIDNLSRVYRVASRIERACRRHGCMSELELVLSETCKAWANLSAFVANSPTRTSPEVPDCPESGPLSAPAHCGVCLLPAASDSDRDEPTLACAGHQYHACCANLWVNRVADVLPALRP